MITKIVTGDVLVPKKLFSRTMVLYLDDTEEEVCMLPLVDIASIYALDKSTARKMRKYIVYCLNDEVLYGYVNRTTLRDYFVNLRES